MSKPGLLSHWSAMHLNTYVDRRKVQQAGGGETKHQHKEPGGAAEGSGARDQGAIHEAVHGKEGSSSAKLGVMSAVCGQHRMYSLRHCRLRCLLLPRSQDHGQNCSHTTAFPSGADSGHSKVLRGYGIFSLRSAKS